MVWEKNGSVALVLGPRSSMFSNSCSLFKARLPKFFIFFENFPRIFYKYFAVNYFSNSQIYRGEVEKVSQISTRSSYSTANEERVYESWYLAVSSNNVLAQRH